MLRYRMMSRQRKSTKEMPNLDSYENLQKKAPQEYNIYTPVKLSTEILNTVKNRFTLRQIPTNNNLPQSIPNDLCGFQSTKILISQTKYFPVKKEKTQEAFFSKITKLFQHQDPKIQISQLNRPKSFLIPRNRPYSSLSQRNKKVMNFSNLCQGQIVLQIDKKNQETLFPGPQKMSTSRALMVFSKINRNYSGERFKVKRERQLNQYQICLDSQKIILQEKEKKQNNLVQKSLEKSISLPKSRGRQKVVNDRKNRYTVEQQFEIGGWEYFQ